MTASATQTELNGAAVRQPLDGPLKDLWSKTAPAKLRKQYPAAGTQRGWADWTTYLLERRQPRPLAELLPGRQSPLTWALPDALCAAEGSELLQRLARLERRASRDGRAADDATAGTSLADELDEWLAAGKLAAAEPAYALEALAWCRALPVLAGLVLEPAWWRLWERLHWLAGEADRGAPPSELTPLQLLTQQWLAIELPLTLAYQLPELLPSEPLGPATRNLLEEELQELVPAAGLLPTRLWPVWRPLLACWTRSLTVAAQLPTARKKKGAARVPSQFAEFVVSSWRLCRADGSQMLLEGSAGRWNRHLFAAANRLLGEEETGAESIARLAAPEAKKVGRRAARFRAPDPAAHAEAAAAAILRSGWERSDVRLACTYDERQVRLELGAGRETLLEGVWGLEVRLAGRPLEQESDWEQVCWYSDADVDYLEIEARFQDEVRVQRQILLARHDRFLLLADAVLTRATQRDAASEPAEIDYAALLPLASSMAWDAQPETTEVLLKTAEPAAKQRARVLPLALPEWRSALVAGQLVRTPAGMQLRDKARARTLLAPLFFDLDRRRLIKPYTWRQLTVAESLKALPKDAAAGYRVEIGKQQWLFYRSLLPGGVRSVLGQQTTREFFAARFKRGSGEAEHLLEIEME